MQDCLYLLPKNRGTIQTILTPFHNMEGVQPVVLEVQVDYPHLLRADEDYVVDFVDASIETVGVEVLRQHARASLERMGCVAYPYVIRPDKLELLYDHRQTKGVYLMNAGDIENATDYEHYCEEQARIEVEEWFDAHDYDEDELEWARRQRGQFLEFLEQSIQHDRILDDPRMVLYHTEYPDAIEGHYPLENARSFSDLLEKAAYFAFRQDVLHYAKEEHGDQFDS
ncbi:MAG: hypothetical protein ABEN55_03740 [Bradymonadaceae bacterium]